MGLLHRQDARVKFLLTLAFLLTLGLAPVGAWPAYILFAAVIVALEVLSGTSWRYYFSRALLALVFVLAAVPLVFRGEGEPLLAFRLAGTAWGVYAAGLERFLSIALKSWLAMQAALLLSVTTEFHALLAAMRQLHLPKLLVAIMGLMWRYLFLFGDEARRLMNARASRSAVSAGHRLPPLAWRANVTGGMAGSLLLRSLERSERVHGAMLARGYNGEPPQAAVVPLAKRDWLLLAGGAVGLAFLWLVSLVFGG
jgi:cobalt/nickel transport system permease protein